MNRITYRDVSTEIHQTIKMWKMRTQFIEAPMSNVALLDRFL